MKNRVVILVVVLVITVGIVGILARNGSKSIEINADAGEEAVQNTVVDSNPVAGLPVERVDRVNVGALEHERDAGGFSNLSRGYIDVDRSGDWSEGDIPLDRCDDGYIIPLEE